MVSFWGPEKASATPISVSFRGLIQNFRRASPPLSYAESPGGLTGDGCNTSWPGCPKPAKDPGGGEVLFKCVFLRVFSKQSFCFAFLIMKPLFHPHELQHGGRKPTETSVTEFCYKSVNLLLEELINIKAILFLMLELFRWQNSSKKVTFLT